VRVGFFFKQEKSCAVVYDLLGDARQRASLKVREHVVDGPYVEALTSVAPLSADEAAACLRKGINHRVTT
jgi:hypothetical protein